MGWRRAIQDTELKPQRGYGAASTGATHSRHHSTGCVQLGPCWSTSMLSRRCHRFTNTNAACVRELERPCFLLRFSLSNVGLFNLYRAVFVACAQLRANTPGLHAQQQQQLDGTPHGLSNTLDAQGWMQEALQARRDALTGARLLLSSQTDLMLAHLKHAIGKLLGCWALQRVHFVPKSRW